VDAPGLAALAEQAQDLAGTVEPHVLDLTDLDAVEHTAVGTDVMVNNAELQLVRPIEEFPPDVFHTVLTVMVEAPFRLIRGALPHMYAQGWGRIVNMSSVHGLRASAFKSAYVAAKHGLEGLSKTAALEGAPHGVTSNCVNPAYVHTPLVERHLADQARAHRIPEERVLTEVLRQDSAVGVARRPRAARPPRTRPRRPAHPGARSHGHLPAPARPAVGRRSRTARPRGAVGRPARRP
jgi:3-hydroxybutyrate dehydrogenase